MTNSQIKNVRTIDKKNKKIGTNRKKMRGFYLTSTTNTLNQRREKTNNTVMTDSTKVLQTLTREKMSRIRKRRRAETKKRKGIRRRKDETKTRSVSKLIRGEREREDEDGRQDNHEPEEG